MRKVTKLPPADQYGNYWLDSARRPNGSCVLKSALFARQGKPVRWYASLGDRGILFTSANEIRYFDSPEKALEEMMRDEPKETAKA